MVNGMNMFGMLRKVIGLALVIVIVASLGATLGNALVVVGGNTRSVWSGTSTYVSPSKTRLDNGKANVVPLSGIFGKPLLQIRPPTSTQPGQTQVSDSDNEGTQTGTQDSQTSEDAQAGIQTGTQNIGGQVGVFSERCSNGVGYSIVNAKYENDNRLCQDGKPDCCNMFVKAHVHDIGLQPAGNWEITGLVKPGFRDRCKDTLWVSVSSDNKTWTPIGKMPITSVWNKDRHQWKGYDFSFDYSGPIRYVKVAVPHCYNDYSEVTVARVLEIRNVKANAQEDSISVSWKTTQPAKGKLCMDGKCVADGAYTKSKQLTITGLEPDTEYTFTIEAEDELGVKATKTATAKTEPADSIPPQVISASVQPGLDYAILTVETDEPAQLFVQWAPVGWRPASRRFFDYKEYRQVRIPPIGTGYEPLKNSTQYYIKFWVMDKAGNYNLAYIDNPIIFETLDGTPPEIRDIQVQSTDRTITISYETDEPAKGKLCIDGKCVADGAYTKSKQLTITGLEPDTEYTFTIEAEDEMGNKATKTGTAKTVDTISPQIEILTPTNNSLITEDPFNLTFAIQNGGDLESYEVYVYDENGVILNQYMYPANPDDEQATLEVETGDGYRQILVRAIDDDGNYGNDVIYVTVDATAPEIQNLTVETGTAGLGDAYAEFTFETSELAYCAIEPFTGFGKTPFISHHVRIEALEFNKTYQYTIVCKDEAGNKANYTGQFTTPEAPNMSPDAIGRVRIAINGGQDLELEVGEQAIVTYNGEDYTVEVVSIETTSSVYKAVDYLVKLNITDGIGPRIVELDLLNANENLGPTYKNTEIMPIYLAGIEDGGNKAKLVVGWDEANLIREGYTRVFLDAFGGAYGSQDPDGQIVNYTWDFDDGTGAIGPITEKVFNAAANYTVVLTVTDDRGAQDQDELPIEVINRPNYVIQMQVGVDKAIVGEPVPVGITVENIGGPYPEATVSLADGTGRIETFAVPGNSGQIQTNWTFDQPGVYNLTASVEPDATAGDGAPDYDTSDNEVYTTIEVGKKWNYIYNSTIDGELVDVGRILDTTFTTTTVRNGSYLNLADVNASIIDASRIESSTIRDSEIYNSEVYNTTLDGVVLRDAYIDPSTIVNSTITADSQVKNSEIYYSTIQNSTVIDSYIYNSTLVNAYADGVNLTNDVLISGCIIQNGQTICASVPGAVAKINGDKEAWVQVNETFTLDGSQSTGQGLTYTWKIGNQVIGDQAVMDYNISDTGVYNITLVATDGAGRESTDVVKALVWDQNSTSASDVVVDKVSVNVSEAHVGQPIEIRVWVYNLRGNNGNNSTVRLSVPGLDTSEADYEVEPATYKELVMTGKLTSAQPLYLSVYVKDATGWGKIYGATLPVCVYNNTAPNAAFTVPELNLTVEDVGATFVGALTEGTTLIFNASASSDPEGDTLTYLWTIGQENYTEEVISKNFTENGTYEVRLDVCDAYGLCDAASLTVDIINVNQNNTNNTNNTNQNNTNQNNTNNTNQSGGNSGGTGGTGGGAGGFGGGGVYIPPTPKPKEESISTLGLATYEYQNLGIKAVIDYNYDADGNKTIVVFTYYGTGNVSKYKIVDNIPDELANVLVSLTPEADGKEGNANVWYVFLGENQKFTVKYVFDGKITEDQVRDWPEPTITLIPGKPIQENPEESSETNATTTKPSANATTPGPNTAPTTSPIAGYVTLAQNGSLAFAFLVILAGMVALTAIKLEEEGYKMNWKALKLEKPGETDGTEKITEEAEPNKDEPVTQDMITDQVIEPDDRVVQ